MRSPLESSIDELYKGPVNDFVTVRTALARLLKGDEVPRARVLQKSGVGLWAMDQVYWHARPLYDVAKSGASPGAVQIAALNGLKTGLR